MAESEVKLFRRFAADNVAAALKDSPVVMVNGSTTVRQDHAGSGVRQE